MVMMAVKNAVDDRGEELTDKNFLILAARISSFFHCSVESY